MKLFELLSVVLVCVLCSQDGESWKTGKCSTNTCINGQVITTPVECESMAKPVCENGLPPLKVYDETGCCYHYECECKFKLLLHFT